MMSTSSAAPTATGSIATVLPLATECGCLVSSQPKEMLRELDAAGAGVAGALRRKTISPKRLPEFKDKRLALIKRLTVRNFQNHMA